MEAGSDSLGLGLAALALGLAAGDADGDALFSLLPLPHALKTEDNIRTEAVTVTNFFFNLGPS